MSQQKKVYSRLMIQKNLEQVLKAQQGGMESSFVTGKPMLSKGASKQYTLSGIKSIKEHRLTFDSTGSERSDNLEQVIRNNNTEIRRQVTKNLRKFKK